MKITILGSGTAVPSLERNSAGLLLQHGGINSLFDCGYGTIHQLLRLGVTYHDIDRIYFTHNHPDHICDLIIFLFSSRYHLAPREKNLEIVAGHGFRQFFDGLTNAFKHWLIPTTYNINIVEQGEETREYGGLSVTARKVNHIDLSLGYRITDPLGSTFALSGDTGYCANMVALGKNADLLILECSFPDSLAVKGHLTPKEAGRLARETGCKKLCLTHFYPPCDPFAISEACRREYAGELILARDLLEFEL